MVVNVVTLAVSVRVAVSPLALDMLEPSFTVFDVAACFVFPSDVVVDSSSVVLLGRLVSTAVVDLSSDFIVVEPWDVVGFVSFFVVLVFDNEPVFDPALVSVLDLTFVVEINVVVSFVTSLSFAVPVAVG